VRILVIGASGATALPALRLLSHTITTSSPAMSNLITIDPGSFEIAVVDATSDLAIAPIISTRLKTAGFDGPTIVVLTDGGFSVAQESWNVTDVVSANAQPAEIDARLRLAYARAPQTRQPDVADPVRDTSAREPITRHGKLTVNHDNFTVTVGNRNVSLTYREFELLYHLVTHPNRAFTRAQLVTHVWGEAYLGGTRTVDVHVRRLRAKLGPEFAHAISTVRSVGYMFSSDEPEAQSSDRD